MGDFERPQSEGPYCDPETRQACLGPIGAAITGEVCLVAANRKGLINVTELDVMAACLDRCLQRPPEVFDGT